MLKIIREEDHPDGERAALHKSNSKRGSTGIASAHVFGSNEGSYLIGVYYRDNEVVYGNAAQLPTADDFDDDPLFTCK